MLKYNFSCKRRTVYEIHKCVYHNLDADDDVWETLDKVFNTEEEAWKYIKTVEYSKGVPFMFDINNYYVKENDSYIIPESIKHTFSDDKNKMLYILSDSEFKSMQAHLKVEVEKFTEKKKLQYMIKNNVEKRKLQ